MPLHRGLRAAADRANRTLARLEDKVAAILEEAAKLDSQRTARTVVPHRAGE